MEGAAGTVLGLTPGAQLISVSPLFQAEYDGMVAYFINGEITKETYKKGIQVDINNWAPHYAVYLVWDHWERVADGINRNKAYKKIE